MTWDGKYQACGCVRVCPNSFREIGLRLSLVILYPSTLPSPIGPFSSLSALPCPPSTLCLSVPGQVFEELCLVLAAASQNYLWSWKNSSGWEVEGPSLVKEPSRQSTSCHLVSQALEPSFLPAPVPGDEHPGLVVEPLALTATFQKDFV